MTKPNHNSQTKNPAILPAARLTAVIDDLNGQLAHLLDAAAAAKEAHWNIRGDNFHALHELFDETASEARDYADDVAERAVQLGGLALGTVQDIGAGTTFGPFPNDTHDWRELARELHGRIVGCATRLRASQSQLSDEPATQDLYVELIRGLEKRAWMLEAHFAH